MVVVINVVMINVVINVVVVVVFVVIIIVIIVAIAIIIIVIIMIAFNDSVSFKSATHFDLRICSLTEEEVPTSCDIIGSSCLLPCIRSCDDNKQLTFDCSSSS